MQKRWFDHGTGPDEIRTIPFIGYDKETGIYAFPEFGYYNGKMVEKNNEGYLAFDRQSIKSSLKQSGSVAYHTGNKTLNPDWYNDFYFIWENKGLAVLSHFTGSLFAEQIRFRQEGFPILELSGARETGKSTMIKFLWKLLGLSKYEGMDPQKMNEKALARKCVQGSNIPVVLTEGDRNETSGQSMFAYDWLKTGWEGGLMHGMGAKNHGFDTIEADFKGTFVIVQNLSVSGGDALLSRFFHINMEANGYNPEIEKRIANLRAMDVEELASFRNEVLTREPELLEKYFGEYDKAHEELLKRANLSEQKFTPRVLQNHAQILAWSHVLQYVFGKQLINDIQLRHFTSYVWERCKDRQNRLQSEHPTLQQFWDYYDIMNWETAMYEGKAVQVEKLNHLSGTGRIAINLPEFDKACYKEGLQKFSLSDLRNLFPKSTTHRFIENKKVRTKLPNKTKATYDCWIFEEVVNG